MLLGKRQRPSLTRITSLSEMNFDLNIPSEPEPSDHPQITSSSLNPQNQIVTVDDSLLDQRLSAMESPRVTQRKHTADYSTNGEEFLRSCSLCKRYLVPGRDIYMYRGDRAFCSLECRQQQIAFDERKEKCSVVNAVVAGEGEGVSAAV